MGNKTPVSQSARTHGLRWRTAHASSIDEKGLIYIFKATQLPPRLVRVLLVWFVRDYDGKVVPAVTHNISINNSLSFQLPISNCTACLHIDLWLNLNHQSMSTEDNGKIRRNREDATKYWEHWRQYQPIDHPAAQQGTHIPVGMSGDDAKYTLSGSKLIVMMINVILQEVESS